MGEKSLDDKLIETSPYDLYTRSTCVSTQLVWMTDRHQAAIPNDSHLTAKFFRLGHVVGSKKNSNPLPFD
jgi:hypothetical protein